MANPIRLTFSIELTPAICKQIVAKALEADQHPGIPTTPVAQRIEELLRNTGKSMTTADIRLAFNDLYDPKAVSRAVWRLRDAKKITRVDRLRVRIASK